jgi:hypothetical protein
MLSFGHAEAEEITGAAEHADEADKRRLAAETVLAGRGRHTRKRLRQKEQLNPRSRNGSSGFRRERSLRQ